MTIVEFLEARITEDEGLARTFQPESYPTLYPSPARVLAECKAKRQTLAAWELTHHKTLLAVLYIMAGVYSDHPDCHWSAD